jgi:hypothetical protein
MSRPTRRRAMPSVNGCPIAMLPQAMMPSQPNHSVMLQAFREIRAQIDPAVAPKL